MNHINNDDDNNDVYSPEELAWKLILDENVDSGALLTLSDDNTKEILFEILITIYLEMIFNYYKLQYLENIVNNDIDNDLDNNINNKISDKEITDKFNNFKIDLTQVNVNTLTNIFCEKFNKIKYILYVRELNKSEYENSKKYRYCTLLLRDSPHDSTYFMMNEQHIDPEKRYHFVLNSLYNKHNNLREIYCTININGKFYKINFNTL